MLIDLHLKQAMRGADADESSTCFGAWGIYYIRTLLLGHSSLSLIADRAQATLSDAGRTPEDAQVSLYNRRLPTHAQLATDTRSRQVLMVISRLCLGHVQDTNCSREDTACKSLVCCYFAG